MRELLTRALWAMADTLDTLRGGLIMAASRVVGDDPMPSMEDDEAYHAWYTRMFPS